VSLLDGEVAHEVGSCSTAARVGVAAITHEEIRARLSEYLEMTLPELERGRVEDHLMRCPACLAYANTLRATSKAVASLPREPAPARAKQRLRDIIGA
jgi:anti-sigma factor RsiW